MGSPSAMSELLSFWQDGDNGGPWRGLLKRTGGAAKHVSDLTLCDAPQRGINVDPRLWVGKLLDQEARPCRRNADTACMAEEADRTGLVSSPPFDGYRNIQDIAWS
jgi:hypothetical protein